MTIRQFINDCTSLDNPIGDFANDILSDKEFPILKSDEEVLEYLDNQTRRMGTNDIFQEFVQQYKRKMDV